MNKSLQVVFYGLLLMGLYFGAAVTFQSCGGDKTKEAEQDLNSRLEGVAQENTHSAEDLFFEDEGSGYDASAGAEPDYSSSGADVGEVDYTAPVPATTPPVTKPSANTTPPPSSPRSVPPSKPATTSGSSYTGDFMLIAGNYLVESNAESMVKKLKAQGYNKAEQVVFDLSQYYTVIAERFDSRSAADRASADLKRKGFDNYVLKSKD